MKTESNFIEMIWGKAGKFKRFFSEILRKEILNKLETVSMSRKRSFNISSAALWD
jgi:hypothetical protein